MTEHTHDESEAPAVSFSLESNAREFDTQNGPVRVSRLAFSDCITVDQLDEQTQTYKDGDWPQILLTCDEAKALIKALTDLSRE